MKCKQIKAGEWVKPVMRGYKMVCCDCGLVHRIDFKVFHWGRGHKVLLRGYRLNRSTAQVRRYFKGAVDRRKESV